MRTLQHGVKGPMLGNREATERNKAVRHARLSTMTCVLVAALCQFQFAVAQTNGATVLTLDEALQLAKSNNRDLKEFGLDVIKQREAVAEAKTHLYPRIDTSVLAAQLLAPIDFTINKGQFGTFPGTGPIPGSNTDLHTPARPIAIAITVRATGNGGARNINRVQRRCSRSRGQRTEK